jgi:hypothetical protein
MSKREITFFHAFGCLAAAYQAKFFIYKNTGPCYLSHNEWYYFEADPVAGSAFWSSERTNVSGLP